MWDQVYDPLHSQVLSTLAAALPVVTLLVLIASNKVKAHIAAIIALIVANLVAIAIFTLPADMSLRATILGAVTGFFPIGWIVLNVIFLYRLTVEKGVFETLQNTIGGVTNDRRLQLLLIAFSFGAFFEGASGFGTPVAVTGAILIGLGVFGFRRWTATKISGWIRARTWLSWTRFSPSPAWNAGGAASIARRRIPERCSTRKRSYWGCAGI